MRAIRLFAFLLAGSLASPLVAATPRLLSPVQGQMILAGEEMRVAWSGPVPSGREWEAFLSLDGGRTFPVRLTPHLSVDVRSSTWTVPLLAADDARIRLRFGDERTEDQLDLPQAFSILASSRGRALAANARDIGRTSFAGEEGSTTWVEGVATGARARLVVPPCSAGMASRQSWESPHSTVDFLKSMETLFAASSDSRPLALRDSPRPSLPPRGSSSRALLALFSRLNV